MLRVATVLSAREWEGELVSTARSTAAVRLVLRAYQPEDIDANDDLDVVIVGAETSWVTPSRLTTWTNRGLRVVGVHPPGDRPARRLLEEARVDEIFSDDTPPSVIIQAVRLLRPRVPTLATDRSGKLIAVTGPRGAPGRTEIAVAISAGEAVQSRTILVDLDQQAPALAVRLGLPPRPDLADAVESVRARGFLARDAVHQWSRCDVIVGSHRPGENGLRDGLVDEVVEAARTSHELVVVDTGPVDGEDHFIKRADIAILVCEGSALGLVRTARLISEWAGPPPVLVLNRVEASQATDVVEAARRWTGLEPMAVVRDRHSIRRAARSARPPERSLRRLLAPIVPAP